jgi:trimethylamine--corrinoid protein Co-methyltransferase
MCQRVLRGIEVNDETLGTEMLLEKGPGGDFLGEEHTVEHMRSEFFAPRLANREKREAMEPNSDALARAREFVESVRAREPQPCLAPKLSERILREFPEIVHGSLGGA